MPEKHRLTNSAQTLEQSNRRRRTSVKQYAAAITAVAEQTFLVCQTLDQIDVETLSKRIPVSTKGIAPSAMAGR